MLIIADRVAETTVTTGTGPLTLAGALNGYQTFASVMAEADTCYYAIEAVDAAGAATGAWESGIATFTSGQLVRTSVIQSSNADAAVDFAAGSKRVFLTLTADGLHSLYYNQTEIDAMLSPLTAADAALDARLDAVEAWGDPDGRLDALEAADVAIDTRLDALEGGSAKPIEHIQVACSDETTALTAGTAKVTFRMPYALTLTEPPRASLVTAQTSGSTFTIDINENGSTILSTKLTIDNGERTSFTAASAPVVSDSSLGNDAEITIDIDQIGDGTAKGLKVILIGRRN